MSDINKEEKVEIIHDSMVNGQHRQAVAQIKEYGLYDFWFDYKLWLKECDYCEEDIIYYFSGAVISYFRTTER